MNKLRVFGAVAAAAVLSVVSAFGGEALPTPVNGVVTLQSGKTYTVTENTDITGIEDILVSEGATLEYDISEGETLTVPFTAHGKGMLIKNGKGTVHYVWLKDTAPDLRTKYYIEYPGYTIVNDGLLKMVDFGSAPFAADVKYSGTYVGRIVINNPGVYNIFGNTTTSIYGLWGDGEITCAYGGGVNMMSLSDDKGKTGETYCQPAHFEGLITGDKLRVCPATRIDLLNPNSTASGEMAINGGSNLGLTSFGLAGGPSSLGKSSYSIRGADVWFRYLGTGETSTRAIDCSVGGVKLTIDGGATGNLILGGKITAGNGPLDKDLVLTGDHPNPCAVTGAISPTVASGFTMSVTKKGAGTWRLESSSSVYDRLTSVENGTLAFASVAAKGTASSLGTAANTADCAISLGASATVGTLAYVGTADIVAPDRLISLTGMGGRLQTDGAALDWTGVTAAEPTSLYLAGAGTAGSVVRNVTGPVSVVKEGAGTWGIDGPSAFAGELAVNGGELVAHADIREKPFDFTWFKLVIRGKIKEIPDAANGGMKPVTDGNVELDELAFFDADGNRVLDGFAFVSPGTENKSYPFEDLSDIQPGQYGWLPNAKSTTYTAYGSRDADKLFDNKVSPAGCCVHYSGGAPVTDDPGSWYTLLVRLPADAPHVASFDLGSYSSPSGGQRFVTDWSLMGSEDGKTWYTLKTYDDPGYANLPSDHAWYSDKTGFDYVNSKNLVAYKTSTGYLPEVEDKAETAGRFANVTKATLGAGGTLTMVGAADFPLLEGRGGAFVASPGCAYAFGALDLVSGDTTVTVPDGATVTVGDSSARMWATGARINFVTEGSGKVDFSGFASRQKEQVYLNGVSLEEMETERIAFFGDSITCGGSWEYVLQYLESARNPGKLVRTLNCGISGDTTGGGLGRLDRDVLARNPARVVVMFGMNDVGLSNYCENPTEQQLAKQRQSLATYAQNMSNIVQRIKAEGIAVTLVTPTPYDEYGDYGGASRYVTANSKGLAACAQIVRDLAAYEDTELVDFHAPMTEIYETGVEFNRSDRVHPENVGHVLMSLIVWKTLGYGEAPYSVKTLAAPGGTLSMTYCPDGLPFPLIEDFTRVKGVIPADYADLNREIVKFTDLPNGRFSLYAGGTKVGTYAAAELAAGVDIAEVTCPSQTASQKAYATMRTMMGKDANLRYVVAMEIRAKQQDPSVDLNDYDAVTNVLERWYQTLTSQKDYYRGVINLYETYKPKEAQTYAEVTDLLHRLRDEATPQSYELSLAQEGVLVIDPGQGDVVKPLAAIAEAEAISIGEGSRLVIRDVASDSELEVKANISGAGGLYIANAYVTLLGDNRSLVGEKIFTNAFVTVASRYGLGSPEVELKNYVDTSTSAYLHFVGNGLTNDVPVHAYGRGYGPVYPASSLAADRSAPLVMNGGLCVVEPGGFTLGNVELKGGLYGAGSPWFSSSHEVRITGPFKVTSGSYLVVSGFTLRLWPNAESTGWQDWLYPTGGGKVICEGENVWGNSLALGSHGDKGASSATFDLNGYDQTFRSVGFYNSLSVEPDWTGLKLYVTSSIPATLTMTGSTAKRQGVRFTGAAGFRYVGTGAWTNTLFRSTTTGTLTVGDGTNKGEVFFDWGARWDGDVVLDGGRFGCDTSNGIGHKAKVTISNGGKLIVPAGVNLRVREVTVDGVKQPDGVYQNVDWIEGEGTVRCGKFGLSVIVR